MKYVVKLISVIIIYLTSIFCLVELIGSQKYFVTLSIVTHLCLSLMQYEVEYLICMYLTDITKLGFHFIFVSLILPFSPAPVELARKNKELN
jgi:hypothetical protein